ncbi:hypothetical protein BH23ACT11_BH23ACT11_16900 [soil metagenome]
MLAAALEGQRLGEAYLASAVRGAGSDEGLVAAALIDRVGRPIVVSPENLPPLDWNVAISSTSSDIASLQPVSVAGRRYEMATRVLDDRGYRIVLVGYPADGGAWHLLRGLFAALLVLVATALAVWSARHLVLQDAAAAIVSFASDLRRHSPGLSTEHAHVAAERSQPLLGAGAEALEAVGQLIVAHQEGEREARGHVAALLQINPSYVLFVTADGRLIDANPAFYAATGLQVADVRDGRAETLNQILQMGPILDRARQSREGQAAMFGLEQTFFSVEDQLRPVDVSLRAVNVGGEPGMVVQATDKLKERRLSAQVDEFSDTLDLMVDQRVARITAGQANNETALADAGLAYVVFEIDGRTRVWSDGMQRLTGADHHEVLDAQAVSHRLCEDTATAQALASWIADDDPSPFFLRTSQGTDLLLRRVRSQADGRSRWVVVGLPVYVAGVDVALDPPATEWEAWSDGADALADPHETGSYPEWEPSDWASVAADVENGSEQPEEFGDGRGGQAFGPFLSGSETGSD